MVLFKTKSNKILKYIHCACSRYKNEEQQKSAQEHCNCDCNHDCDYLGNVIEYGYDYLGFLT